MTRGNQRELAREKNKKKMEQLKKTQGKAEVSTEKRMETDAEKMREKQKKAAEKKAAEDAAAAQQQPKVVKVDPLTMKE
uniref:4F5 domain-containing protein n=1 Tax=Meloidogyne hapla TaxID=6305 RepID=A0A1I8C293_MELHA